MIPQWLMSIERRRPVPMLDLGLRDLSGAGWVYLNSTELLGMSVRAVTPTIEEQARRLYDKHRNPGTVSFWMEDEYPPELEPFWMEDEPHRP